MKRTIMLLFLMGLISILISCGDKPESQIETIPAIINLPADLDNMLRDSAIITIYSDNKIVSQAKLGEIKDNRNFFVLNLSSGEHLIEVFITGPNENVIYMLDRKPVNLIPEVKNSVDIQLGPPIKFDTKVINLSLNQEIKITARVETSKLKDDIKNPEIHWTIDNIEGGNEEIGKITASGNTAILKGPATLPSSNDHYLGAYFELENKKYVSIVKINYIE
ncbi:MAG: hypothetical protein ACP5QK_01645 [Myxococcota bacterium]